jgi:predicted amidohydrolase YtcJ
MRIKEAIQSDLPRKMSQRERRTRTIGLAALIVGFSWLAACRSGGEPVTPADLILSNGAVYTLNPAQPWAQAAAVGGGRIVFVGSSAGAKKYQGEGTKVIDLAGKMVLPGFQDSHIHLISGGVELGQCSLNDLQTKEGILSKIRSYAAANPEKEWIVGGGWPLTAFPGGNPTKEDLDAEVSDRPIFLSAVDGHSTWVNSRALDKAGFQIHVHAIGDRAIRMTLDAMEEAGKANGLRDARHHICHLELIDPVDIPRFPALGVVANFQALWAYRDSYITELTEPLLGPERSSRLYPIGSVVRSGARYAGGSDWSVSSLNPLEAIEVAVTRRGPDADAGPAWLPGELIDLPTAIAAYTTNGAFLSFEEKTRGTIEAGMAADLVVLDSNLFKIPAQEISETHVVLTLLDGKTVYPVSVPYH